MDVVKSFTQEPNTAKKGFKYERNLNSEMLQSMQEKPLFSLDSSRDRPGVDQDSD